MLLFIYFIRLVDEATACPAVLVFADIFAAKAPYANLPLCPDFTLAPAATVDQIGLTFCQNIHCIFHYPKFCKFDT